MAKIYAYADRLKVLAFQQYAAGLGLNAASLLRLLIVRRVRLGGGSESFHPAAALLRSKVPVDLPSDLRAQFGRLAVSMKRQPGEIAAAEIDRELYTRSLERFLMEG